jgi:Pectate lyase superfamily protein
MPAGCVAGGGYEQIGHKSLIANFFGKSDEHKSAKQNGHHRRAGQCLRGALSGGLLSLVLLSFPAAYGQGVLNFGAKGDGVTDDTAALQNAITSTSSGTLNFPAGTYVVSTTLNLLSNVTYSSSSGARLVTSNGAPIFALPGANPSGITITGLTFDGGGVTAQGGAASNIKITGNTFQNITASSGNWTYRSAIFASGFRNSSIDHNSFKNVRPGGSTRPDGTIASIEQVNAGIETFGLDATSIDHNTFDLVGEGIRVCFSQSYQSNNVYIGYNAMKGIHRMGIEIQGAIGCGASQPAINGPDTNNIVIENNTITDFDDPFWDSFGISYANPAPYGGDGGIIRNNTIVVGETFYWQQQGPSGNYAAGIEAAGASLQVYNNVTAGYAEQGITIDGAPNAQIHDNYSCALGAGAQMGVGQETAPSPGANYFNNTVLTTCPAVLPSVSETRPLLPATRVATPIAAAG